LVYTPTRNFCFAQNYEFLSTLPQQNCFNKDFNKTMTLLSVNINKIATLRNARGGNTPNVQDFAIKCQQWGADGITVHPRPDGRHIRYDDVEKLKPIITTSFNIEGYPDDNFIQLVLRIKPEQVTLVPDPPEAITSNAGWDIRKHHIMLKEIVQEFQNAGIKTSLFVAADESQIIMAPMTGTNRIELYTEDYAKAFSSNKEKAISAFVHCAKIAQKMELEVNAGHDLNLQNLAFLNREIPFLHEVSIGHALVSDALIYGMQNTIQLYKRQLNQSEN
jgi:pyridoxine 5-phosphate synthase